MALLGRPPKPIIDRALQKVEKGQDCWLWRGALSIDGYGFIKSREGKQLRAHRVIYQHFLGEIPEGMLVCHKCDVPNCVNPAHLFLGTVRDNSKDMIKKSRQNNGGGRQKTTERQRREIASRSESILDSAKRYNLSLTTIKKIRKESSPLSEVPPAVPERHNG